MNSSTDNPQTEEATKVARKFTYETVFSPEGEILRAADGFRSQFTLAEVEEFRALAFQEGQRTEIVRAEHSAAAALQAIAHAATRQMHALDHEISLLRREAAILALAAARKLAGAALARFPEAQITAALEDALTHLRSGPRLIVRTAPETAPRVEADLRAIAEAHGFAGAVLVRADPKAGPGDCVLDWGEGAIAHDFESASRLIEEGILRALSLAPEADPNVEAA